MIMENTSNLPVQFNGFTASANEFGVLEENGATVLFVVGSLLIQTLITLQEEAV
jgi:hypothetical protein